MEPNCESGSSPDRIKGREFDMIVYQIVMPQCSDVSMPALDILDFWRRLDAAKICALGDAS